MNCHGTRHIWAYVAVDTGSPPNGMPCSCGGYTWQNDTCGVTLSDGVDMVALADAPFPTGLCARCGRPIDDHGWDAKGPLCPKVTA